MQTPGQPFNAPYSFLPEKYRDPQLSELACEIDMLRSLKKKDIRSPDGGTGFWVMEQKAGNVTWQDVNSLVRPGIVRLFTYQMVSRGASGVLYFFWRQPRIGSANLPWP